jgi:RNA polymerase sigma factor (sigma-70 family)
LNESSISSGALSPIDGAGQRRDPPVRPVVDGERTTGGEPRLRVAATSNGAAGHGPSEGDIAGPHDRAATADEPGCGTPAIDPDRDLVARAVGGDRDAFAALLRRHYDRIHRVAWRFTGSRADAEDVAQEVCCALVEKIGSFRGEARFTTWLIGIVVNACRDHRRRRLSFGRLIDGLAVLAPLAAAPDGRDAYRRSWLASELARLDPVLRTTVVLVVGEDLSHAEAARTLGVAESTVSWRMHEARRKLARRTMKQVRDEL